MLNQTGRVIKFYLKMSQRGIPQDALLHGALTVPLNREQYGSLLVANARHSARAIQPPLSWKNAGLTGR